MTQISQRGVSKNLPLKRERKGGVKRKEAILDCYTH